ncbi:MAG: hypothetical protein WAQ52_14360 [Terriglobales bacterium]
MANPGDRLTATLYFWNGTDAELPVHMEAEDIRPQDEEGHVAGESEEAVNSLKSWVKPVYPDVTVFPKQEIALNFTIDVPANADPGTHWGGVVVRTVPVPAGGGAAVQVRLGTIVLLRVSGEAKEKLALESVSVPGFLESPPILLEVRFRNEGTVHEAPAGEIEVRNMFGWLVATSTLPVRNVLPGDVRKVEASLGDGLWLGRYAVTLRATYGEGGEELASRRVIWVVPWRTQGWKFLVAILFIAFVIWKRRNFGRAWYALRTGKPPPEDY